MDKMLGFKQFIVEMANPWPSGKEGEKQIISALAGEEAHPRAKKISDEIKKKYDDSNKENKIQLKIEWDKKVEEIAAAIRRNCGKKD